MTSAVPVVGLIIALAAASQGKEYVTFLVSMHIEEWVSQNSGKDECLVHLILHTAVMNV